VSNIIVTGKDVNGAAGIARANRQSRRAKRDQSDNGLPVIPDKRKITAVKLQREANRRWRGSNS
jgi:hypothetical protein